MSDESIDRIARMLADAVPQGLRSVRDDLEKNFRAVLRSGLAKLDLVTREEFEVQEAVLARSREKLTAMQLRLEAIEQRASTAAANKSAKTATAKSGKKTRKKKSDPD